MTTTHFQHTHHASQTYTHPSTHPSTHTHVQTVSLFDVVKGGRLEVVDNGDAPRYTKGTLAKVYEGAHTLLLLTSMKRITSKTIFVYHFLLPLAHFGL
jgi:hypothetical protein